MHGSVISDSTTNSSIKLSILYYIEKLHIILKFLFIYFSQSKTKMNKQSILQKQIQLLNELISSLERQLTAKHNQLGVCNEHIKGLKEQNLILTNFIEIMKQKWSQAPYQVVSQISPFRLSQGYSYNLDIQCDMNDLRALLQQMSNQLDKKCDEISNYKYDILKLSQKIQKQQLQMASMAKKNRETQQKILVIMKKNKQLEQECELLKKQSKQKISFGKLSQKKGQTFKKLQALKLMRQNNQQLLQRGKDRLSYRGNSISKSPLKKILFSPNSCFLQRTTSELKTERGKQNYLYQPYNKIL